MRSPASPADALSGVARCIVRTAPGHHGRTRYTATATNGANLSTTVHGSYRVLTVWLQGVPWRNGKFHVRAGRTVTVRVASHQRPRYQWAAPANTATKPHGGDTAFAPMGTGQWRLRVTLSPEMTRRYSQWNLGVRVGKKLQVIRIAFRH